MKKPIYLHFTLEEYQRRLDALRSRMEHKGVDAMLVTTPENLYYLTGQQTPGYYWFQTLIVPMDREPVFITRRIEDDAVQQMSWVEDSRPYEDFNDWIAQTRNVLVSLGLEGKRIGLENDSWFLTSRDYIRLTTMMTEARFEDCSGLVEQGRIIKSPQEIEYIRQAAKAAEAGMKAGIEASVVGATENEVAAEVHHAQILAGSEYTGLPIFVASGPRSDITHATWYRRRLGDNESMLLEIPACINRYHAAIFRPVYLGDPPAALVRGVETVLDILQDAKSHIKAGVRAREVYELVDKRVEEEDLGYTLDRRVGYSIGIAFPPDWGEGEIISMWKGEDRPLQAGMTFHLLAGATKVPGVGMFICTDTILVTEEGCETLTDGVEHKLYVK